MACFFIIFIFQRGIGEEPELGGGGGGYREELDRAMTSIQVLQTTLRGGDPAVPVNARLCPMCEAMFPSGGSQEEFELHVMDHFTYDSDPDTLQYCTSDEHVTQM